MHLSSHQSHLRVQRKFEHRWEQHLHAFKFTVFEKNPKRGPQLPEKGRAHFRNLNTFQQCPFMCSDIFQYSFSPCTCLNVACPFYGSQGPRVFHGVLCRLTQTESINCKLFGPNAHRSTKQVTDDKCEGQNQGENIESILHIMSSLTTQHIWISYMW